MKTNGLSQSAEIAARQLLGAQIIREVDGQIIRGKIIETEAYDESDAASHSFRGMTARNSVMFGPGFHAYVYFTYGMHYCFNIVIGEVGQGSAVLIRALEPLEGIEFMQQNRIEAKSIHQLTNGPAKLCQALVIDRRFNGHDLNMPPLQIVLQKELPNELITQTTRIGIKKNAQQPWRFYITNNPYVSRHA